MTIMVGIPVGNQLQVMFVNLRRVFEVRERASQMYHWSALLTAQFLIDYLCNVLGGLVEFNSWYWARRLPPQQGPVLAAHAGVRVPVILYVARTNVRCDEFNGPGCESLVCTAVFFCNGFVSIVRSPEH